MRHILKATIRQALPFWIKISAYLIGLSAGIVSTTAGLHTANQFHGIELFVRRLKLLS
jgi:hypothetical protein